MSTKTKIITGLFLLSFFFFTNVQAQESKPEPDQKPPSPDSAEPSIQNITFDKLSYLEGETAKLSFTYLAGNNDTAALDLIINLKDEKDNSCSAPLEKKLTKDNAGLMNLEMIIDKDCVNFRSEINIKNKDESEWTETKLGFSGAQYSNAISSGVNKESMVGEQKAEVAETVNGKQKESKNNVAKIALFVLMVIIPISLLIAYFIKKKIDVRRMLVILFSFAFLGLGLLLGGEASADCQIPNTDKYVKSGESARLSHLQDGYWWWMEADCLSDGTWSHSMAGGWKHGTSFGCNFNAGNGNCHGLVTGGPDTWMNYNVQSSSDAMSWNGKSSNVGADWYCDQEGNCSYGCRETVCRDVTDEWGNVTQSCTQQAVACPLFTPVSGSLSCPDGFVVYERLTGYYDDCRECDYCMDRCTPRCLTFSASQIVPPITDGECGTANNGNYATAPSGSALCSTGTPSTVTESGSSWTWTCIGSGIGSKDSPTCTATKTCVPKMVCVSSTADCTGKCGQTISTQSCFDENFCGQACTLSCSGTKTCPPCLKIDSYREVAP